MTSRSTLLWVFLVATSATIAWLAWRSPAPRGRIDQSDRGSGAVLDRSM